MTAPARGRLYLVPTPLDFGVAGPRRSAPGRLKIAGATSEHANNKERSERDDNPTPELVPASLDELIPLEAIRVAARLTHWVAENAKSARAFLKRVDAVMPLVGPLQSLQITELPRTPKGGLAPAGAAASEWGALLAPALIGNDIGLISEAGMPAVADPGAGLVAAAHTAGVPVVPLAGPNAIVLALAASGLNGQSFAFVGYLPTEAGARASRIRELENLSRRAGQAQLMIETPYRNAALLTALLATLAPTTRLSVSCGLTLATGWTRSTTTAAWRARPVDIPVDVPAVFGLQAD